ncbi:MAG: FIST signal transduction protein [Kofleriaceae bacterium]
MTSVSRQVAIAGTDPERIARSIVDRLAAPDLRIAFVFADWRLDPVVLAAKIQAGLSAPVVGGTSVGVIQRELDGPTVSAVGLGLYGDWVRVGVAVATELSRAALTRSRDAVREAATALGTTADALDPQRHVGVTIIEGMSGHEEASCIGAAAAAPTIRMVGGCTVSDPGQPRSYLWANGQVHSDAALVVLLSSELPFHAVSSSHLESTELKTVVTAASGREIMELDGKPAAPRLRDLVAGLGDELDVDHASHSFARFIAGVPYVRSITRMAGSRLWLTTAVETGHVLRVMRPGDLLATTQRDLSAAAERVGGAMSLLLGFSCVGRHCEAAGRGLAGKLAETYAAHATIGFQSSGEQSGMLLLNHTLTGLAIGEAK